MAAEEKQIQRIDDYLNNELSGREKYLFEKRLAHDKELAAELQRHRTLLAGIRESSRREMKAHFAALEFTRFRSAGLMDRFFRNTVVRWASGIAACFLLAAIAYNWFIQEQQPQQLFAHYYTSYPNIIEAIERGNTTADTRSKAMQAYENGNYSLAIQNLEKILASQPQDVALAFYLGVAYLENNQPDRAIQQLEKAALEPPHDFTTQAVWYLSLAYVKNNDTRQAIPLLQQLVKKESEYSQRAARLLKEVE